MMLSMAFDRLYEIIQDCKSNLIHIFTRLTPFLFMSIRKDKNASQFLSDPQKISLIYKILINTKNYIFSYHQWQK